MRTILFFCALSIVLGLGAEAVLAACPKPSKEPIVKIEYQMPDPEYVYTEDQDDMQQRIESAAGYTHGPWHLPVGLTSAEFGARYETQVSVAKAKGGYCVALRELTVTLGYDDHVIYVTPAYEEGSCEFEAILDHEVEHAEINLESLRRYKPQIREAISRLVTGRRSILVHNKSQVRSAYIAEIERQLTPVLKQFAAHRARQHATIDNRDSYERVYARCNNW